MYLTFGAFIAECYAQGVTDGSVLEEIDVDATCGLFVIQDQIDQRWSILDDGGPTTQNGQLTPLTLPPEED